MARSRAAVSTGLAAPKMDAELGGATGAAAGRSVATGAAAAAGASVTEALLSSNGTVRGFRDNFGLSLVGSKNHNEKPSLQSIHNVEMRKCQLTSGAWAFTSLHFITVERRTISLTSKRRATFSVATKRRRTVTSATE